MQNPTQGINARAQRWRQRHPRAGAFGTVGVRTVKAAVRIRVVGLAAEAAFFSLLSLPALLLGIIGTLGHLRGILGADTVLQIRSWVLELSGTALTPQTVNSVVAPLVDDFLSGTQSGLLSVTFLVSLWSGSRAMNVFIESITIAYGLESVRGIVRQRLLSLVAYIGGILFALVVLPVLVAGPNLVETLLPAAAGYLHLLYWPVVTLLSLVCLVALYVISVPVATPIWRHVPGAILAMIIWLLGSFGLRAYLEASLGQVTIYGSLAAPIAVLIWLWVTALAVLIGAALNADIDAMWPTEHTAAARARIAIKRQEHAAWLAEQREEALQSLTESDDSVSGSSNVTDKPAEQDENADTSRSEPEGPEDTTEETEDGTESDEAGGDEAGGEESCPETQEIDTGATGTEETTGPARPPSPATSRAPTQRDDTTAVSAKPQEPR